MIETTLENFPGQVLIFHYFFCDFNHNEGLIIEINVTFDVPLPYRDSNLRKYNSMLKYGIC